MRWMLGLIALVAQAQNPLARPDPFVGLFEGQNVALDLKGASGKYKGTLKVQGQSYAASVSSSGASGTGTFAVNGQEYRFSMTPTSEGFLLASEGAEYRLVRQGSTPSAGATSVLVGTWRHPQGYARFNADGTGEVDGSPGRYEIRGSQLTMIGAQGQVTLPFAVDGDRLTMTVNGQPVLLLREKPGVAGVRMELVGKWCWVSQVYANNGGARQSNRCLTLEANGTYVYEGLTDSYNPNGGSTGQSRDTGTWEATENTLTGRSRSGKVVTYRLEKRNHPKNTADPMIVLDGQPFVSFYKKNPW